jgi:LPS export ABC transporter protein LptC
MNKLLSIINKRLYTAALITSCCFVCGCENEQSVIDEWTKDKKMVEEIIQVESYFSEGGKMKSKLTAPLMLRVQSDTQYVEFPNSLHADFYDDSARIESRLDALYGKYYESYNKVYLRDSVVVVSVKGDTLRCHDLWWDQGKGIFYTDSIATYRSPGNDITGGKGMEATQDFKSVTFKYPMGSMKIAGSGFAE